MAPTVNEQYIVDEKEPHGSYPSNKALQKILFNMLKGITLWSYKYYPRRLYENPIP